MIRVRVCPNQPVVVFQALGSDSRWKGIVASSTSNWKHQGIGRREGKLHDALIVDEFAGVDHAVSESRPSQESRKELRPLFDLGRAYGSSSKRMCLTEAPESRRSARASIPIAR